MSKKYKFRLFVSGATERSLEAVKDVKQLCEKFCSGNYDLEIIDIHQQPALTEKDRIIATPTLLKDSPSPECRVVGNMQDLSALRAEFDL